MNATGKTTYYGSSIILAIWFLFLLVMAFTVRFTEFVANNTGTFIAETLILSLLTALPIFIVIFTRGSSKKKVALDFFLIYLKVMVFWILGEFSGLTDRLFKQH
jgi:hypothetical protein